MLYPDHTGCSEVIWIIPLCLVATDPKHCTVQGTFLPVAPCHVNPPPACTLVLVSPVSLLTPTQQKHTWKDKIGFIIVMSKK